MSEQTEDPFAAFAQHYPDLERLAEPVPPWGVASGDPYDGATSSQKQDFPEELEYARTLPDGWAEQAHSQCREMLESAQVADPLFRPTFDQLFSDMQQATQYLQNRASDPQSELIRRCAWMTKHFPDPKDAEAWLNRPGLDKDLEGSARVTLQLHEAGQLHASAQELDQFVQEAQLLLDPAGRSQAREHVLATVYGDRYQFYLAQQEQPGTPPVTASS